MIKRFARWILREELFESGMKRVSLTAQNNNLNNLLKKEKEKVEKLERSLIKSDARLVEYKIELDVLCTGFRLLNKKQEDFEYLVEKTFLVLEREERAENREAL